VLVVWPNNIPKPNGMHANHRQHNCCAFISISRKLLSCKASPCVSVVVYHKQLLKNKNNQSGLLLSVRLRWTLINVIIIVMKRRNQNHQQDDCFDPFVLMLSIHQPSRDMILFVFGCNIIAIRCIFFDLKTNQIECWVHPDSTNHCKCKHSCNLSTKRSKTTITS
jgi:hypothetical protein